MELNEALNLILKKDREQQQTKEPISQEKMVELITKEENSFYGCLMNLVAVIGGKPRRNKDVIATTEGLIKSFQQRISEMTTLGGTRREELAAAIVVSYFNDPGVIVRAMIEHDVRKEEAV